MNKKIFIPLMSFFFAVVPAQSATETITASSHASIATVLELAISQQGQSELKFGNITPSAIRATQAQPIQVLVDIFSNSGERYQVTQVMNTPLQNAAGDLIPNENLTFTTRGVKSQGAGIISPVPMTASPQVIFTSDTTGTSDTIEAIYNLNVPVEQAPGDYSAYLTFTVSSL